MTVAHDCGIIVEQLSDHQVEVPDVDIVLINRPAMQPLGGGEASSTATGAAIANAVFDAVGVRLRQAPFTPERVLRALRPAAG